ncbi:MAG: glycosyltransferase family 4 protein, partial [Saprospiraceae bacterium]
DDLSSSCTRVLNNDEHPYENIDTVNLNTDINYLGALFNLLGSSSYNIERFTSKDMKKKLQHILLHTSYDVVQLESLYMAPYAEHIKPISNAFIIMRSHNLEFKIWEDMANNQSNVLLRWYYNLAARRLKKYEQDFKNSFDLLLAISEIDQKEYQKLSYSIPSMAIPIGIELKQYPKNFYEEKPMIKLAYIGSLDWRPNIEAVEWFFKEVWPTIYKNYENIEFHLAGRNPVDVIKNLEHPGLYFHGEIESAIDFISNQDIIIVPLLSGSGVRVKVLESMALGKLVISSSKGFEGINIQNNVNAMVANDTEEFIATINKALESKKTIRQVGEAARLFIENNYNPETQARQILKLISEHNKPIEI